MKNLTIDLLNPDDDPILAGRVNGRRAFVRALEGLPVLTEPMVLLLNFIRAEVVTSSFLAEFVVPLRDHLRLRQPPCFVVLANVQDNVREEVEELLGRTGEAMLACRLSADGKVSSVELVGRLDEKLKETFELVARNGGVSAAELHAASRGAQAIGPTAWNNRLSALAAKSLIVETLHGRAKKYRTVLEIAHGT
jgi:hypothetical protein